MTEHADHLFEARQQVVGSMGLDIGRHIVRIEGDHTVGRGVEHFTDFQLHIGLIALLFAQQQLEIRACASDLAGGIIAGIGVGHPGVVSDVACQYVGLLHAPRLDVVAGDQRKRQVNWRMTGVRRHNKDHRLGVPNQLEQAAVGQDS
ncbi:hypothetical protein D3C84_946610 [compost metagenome]